MSSKLQIMYAMCLAWTRRTLVIDFMLRRVRNRQRYYYYYY